MQPRDLADVKANAEGLIYTTEKSLEEYGHVLSPHQVDLVQHHLTRLKSLLEGDDVDALAHGIRELELACHRWADTMGATPSSSPATGSLFGITPHPLEFDTILDDLLNRAKTLVERDELPGPLASVIDSTGVVIALAADPTESGIAHALLKNWVRDGGLRAEYLASGILIPTFAAPDQEATAVSAHLDSASGASLVVDVPYSVVDGRLSWHEARISEGAHDVFPSA